MQIFHELIFIICISSYIGEENNGNLDISINDSPWLVSIQFDFFGEVEHVCGGVIISDVYVLTAASCFDGALDLMSFLSVHAGIDNIYDTNHQYEQIRTVSEIIVHPNYTSKMFFNNLALIRVSSEFNLASLNIAIISLSNVTLFKNVNLLTIGWNHVVDSSNSYIRKLLLRKTIVRESIQCTVNHSFDSNTQFCASGCCQNNSGGPMMIYSNYTRQYELVAIISFRNACTSEGIFTRTMPYFNWILDILKTPIPSLSTHFTISSTTTVTPKADVLGPPISFECNLNYRCGCSSTSVIFHDEFPFSIINHSIRGRIVGGENAQAHSWPWIVSLRISNKHFCSGSLLNEEWVLTAAHCMTAINETTVHIGVHQQMSFGSQILSINRVIIHSEYVSAPEHVNDIAVFRLSAPVQFMVHKNSTGRVCLPRKTVPLDYPIVGTNLAVIGWGRLFHNGPVPDVLRQVRVKRIANDDERCMKIITDQNRQFCAMVNGGGKDSCQGDSGGPIHQWINNHWIQVGIVSFGKSCGDSNHSGVYTKLSAYHSWFESLENEVGVIEYESFSIKNISEVSSTIRYIQHDFMSIVLFFLTHFLID